MNTHRVGCRQYIFDELIKSVLKRERCKSYNQSKHTTQKTNQLHSGRR